MYRFIFTGKKLSSKGESSTAGVAIGVTVALCILLIALAIIGKKLYASKTPKATSVSSFTSSLSHMSSPSASGSLDPLTSDKFATKRVVVAWGDGKTVRPKSAVRF